MYIQNLPPLGDCSITTFPLEVSAQLLSSTHSTPSIRLIEKPVCHRKRETACPQYTFGPPSLVISIGYQHILVSFRKATNAYHRERTFQLFLPFLSHFLLGQYL
jgi:hypothetical protein